MALAGNEHHVAGPGPGDDVRDGRAAIADFDNLCRRSGGTGQDGRPDLGGILVARVVIGDHHQVRQFGRRRAHRRTFARVAVAAGAEDDGDAVRGRRVAQRLEHSPQRSRFVRVVDQRQEVLTAVDRLQPAGHPCIPQSRRGLLRGHPDRVQERQCDKTIGHVVAARQSDTDEVVHADGIDRGEFLRPVGQVRHLLGGPAGSACRADRDGVVGACGHRAARLVVDADHRGAGVRRRNRIEQPGLGFEVVGHGRVEVEVVAGEVGEPTGREADTVDAAQRQRVTGHLHDAGVRTAFDHHGQQCLQRGRLRCGQRTGDVGAVDPHTHGADQTRGPASRTQTGLHEVGGGGLPGRAGDTDDGQRLRGPAVDLGGERAEHRARRRVQQHRDTVGNVQQRQTRRIGEYRDRTARDGVGRVAGTVGGRPGQGREQVAGPRLLAP